MENMKLMLVDDEERFLSTTEKLIKKKGYDVLTAKSGGEAIDLLSRHPVHVVILDVKMPGLDGIATLKWIKQLHPMVEVIMLTGHATVETAVDGLKSGAHDYLMKPVNIDDLLDKAEEAFTKIQKLDERIRLAQARTFMRSPREILKRADKE
jgi:DNA-binding NtrC family response regulator